MARAEHGWRERAAAITAEYHTAQTALAALAPPVAGPHIPGMQSAAHAEFEADRQLFSAPAQAERLFKLQCVKEAHVQMAELYARTETQRVTLNHVLDGTWQSLTLDRAQLDRLMNAPVAAPGARPLNFQHVVGQWNESLGKMQQALTGYLETRTCQQRRWARLANPSTVCRSTRAFLRLFLFAFIASTSVPYLAGLTQANSSIEQHLKEHSLKLTNLRTLSHHLRSSLLPELESDLAALQKSLKAAGVYSGPLSPPPALIPPTPFRPNERNTSMVAPPTPLVQNGAQQARVQFTPNQAGQFYLLRGECWTESERTRRVAHI